MTDDADMDCEWMDELYKYDQPLPCAIDTLSAMDVGRVHVISLGCFCGVKLSIQRLGLGAQHLPFDWIRTRIGAVTRFLQTDFEGFFDTDAPVDVPNTGGKISFRSRNHSFWHDDIRELRVREKLLRRVARLKALGAEPTVDDHQAPTLLFVRALATTGEIAHVNELLEELVKQFGSTGTKVFLLAIVGYQSKLSGPYMIDSSPGLLLYCASKSIHETGSEFPYCDCIQWAMRHIQAHDCQKRLTETSHKLTDIMDLLTSPLLESTRWGLDGWCGRRSFSLTSMMNSVPQTESTLISQEPRILSQRDLLARDEIDELMTLAAGRWTSLGGARMEVTLAFAETIPVAAIEDRLSALLGSSLPHLGKLVLVRHTGHELANACSASSSTEKGMTVFVPLLLPRAGVDVCFPVSRLHIQLTAGGALAWPGTLSPDEVCLQMCADDKAVGEMLWLECFVGVSPQRPQPEVVHYTQIDSRNLLAGVSTASPFARGKPPLVRFAVSVDPSIQVIPDFLSSEDCDHLMSLSCGCWSRSRVTTTTTVYLDEAEKHKVEEVNEHGANDIRTSQSFQLRAAQTGIVASIEHRLAAASGHPVDNLERLHMVKYEPGQFFREHHDGVNRPKTCFIFLNDQPDSEQGSDENGETCFPKLGISFVPRRGTLVMWNNLTPAGAEDERVNHVGSAPKQWTKYGVNCFFQDIPVRHLHDPLPGFSAEESSLVVVGDLAKKKDSLGGGVADAAALTVRSYATFTLFADPAIIIAPAALTAEQVQHFLGCAEKALGEEASQAAFIHCGEPGVVAEVESMISAISRMPLIYLQMLRLVRPSARHEFSDRGPGQKGAYICLGRSEQVLFPKLGVRVEMKSGDMLVWPNIVNESMCEDMRTVRVHLAPGVEHASSENDLPSGIDIRFCDEPVLARLF
eukprot:TRINITY_DN7571_c1_g2_i6.p1 TRINITY_DN7571_c1_g2~~TRINITY_DN7571_c1_g2_i6.p1  ORF type:complete len:914 (-),score=141.56 TRINITY_DN7571_c1_g2_i6:513-3254(-)